VNVRDRSLKAKALVNPKADPADPNQVGAPIPGVVASVAVELNETVRQGDRLLVLEAMKMQSTLYAPVPGRIVQKLAHPGQQVEAKDLLFVIQP
jgi:pyruvate carboxylase